MTDPQITEAKHPLSVAAGPYGHPFHPILVTVPIGAWVTSLVLDLVAMGGGPDAGGMARAAAWAVAIGVVGALVAAVFGVMDYLRIPRGTPAARVALAHLALNVGVVLAFGISWGLRAGRGLDQPVDAVLIVLSVVALGALGLSGWLGGKLTYGYGVRVAAEADQAEGYVR